MLVQRTPEENAQLQDREMALREADEEMIAALHQPTPHFDRLLQALMKEVEVHVKAGYSPEAALEVMQEQDELRFGDGAAHQPVQSLQWRDLQALERRCPGNMQRAIDAMRSRARQEIVSGQDGMKAVDVPYHSPYNRARYLALLDELSEGWHPRNGIERTLIQQMAQAHTNYLEWQARLQAIIAAEQREEPKKEWQPRLTQSQALEQAMNMSDRFQRMFLRTQRALRDMRRFTINVGNVGQINVADQQVNVTETPK